MQPTEMTPQQAIDALQQLSEQVPLRWADTMVRLKAIEVLRQEITPPVVAPAVAESAGQK